MSSSLRKFIRVLFVDDEEDFNELAKKHLDSERIQLTITSSPIEALDLAKDDGFDAIVSDYKMPEMDGIELFEELKSEGVKAPFILITGKGEEDVAMDALNAGMDRYHKKVNNPEEFFSDLRRAILDEVVRDKSEKQLQQLKSWLDTALEKSGLK